MGRRHIKKTKNSRIGKPEVVKMKWGTRYKYDLGVFIDHEARLDYPSGEYTVFGYKKVGPGQYDKRILGHARSLSEAEAIAEALAE